MPDPAISEPPPVTIQFGSAIPKTTLLVPQLLLIAMMTPTLPYTAAESAAAHKLWHAACGHHSIAAATGRTLDAVKQACESRGGWMNSGMISGVLRNLKTVEYTHKPNLPKDPESAINLLRLDGRPIILRLQFEGSWLNPGTPRGAANQRTHYIAVLGEHIMDTMHGANLLIPISTWLQRQPENIAKFKRSTGYHFTNSWTIHP